MTPIVFIKDKVLVLGTSSLATGNYVIMDLAKTIWVHKQDFYHR